MSFNIYGNSAGSQLIKLIRSALRKKQNKLTGTPDQVVGFDTSGNATVRPLTDLKGDAGTRGNYWLTGTGITGTSTADTVFSNSGITDAIVGDMYMNTDTCNVYRCTNAGSADVAKWTYVGCLKGTKGEPGTNATTTAVATTSVNGLMASTDKSKLNKIVNPTNSTAYVVQKDVSGYYIET